MKYRVQITENGKSWLLPSVYTYIDAIREVELQEDLNGINAILGESPATFDILPVK